MSVAPSGPIRFQRPAFPSAAAIEGYFSLARERRWFSNNGPCLHLLAERLSERTGASCLPVASGTLGLMVAAAAMRLRDGGDENAAEARGAAGPAPSNYQTPCSNRVFFLFSGEFFSCLST